MPGRYGPIAALRTPVADPVGSVLLLPGYTGSKEDFAPLLDPIAAAGIEAIAVDLPGQYESPGPQVETEYLPAMLGAVVVELVEKIVADGHRVLLLGHSFGGLVARGAVLGGAPVSGLVLLDSGPAALPEGPRRQALLHGVPVLREQGAAAAWELRQEFNERSPGWSATPAELRAFEHTVFLRSSPVALAGMGRALLDEQDLVAALAGRLAAAAVPCAVVCGAEDDAWAPASQHDMARRLAAEFHRVPEARHSPNTENPASLLALLLPLWRRWLTH